jgi:hypothetical protein
MSKLAAPATLSQRDLLFFSRASRRALRERFCAINASSVHKGLCCQNSYPDKLTSLQDVNGNDKSNLADAVTSQIAYAALSRP